MSRDLRVTCDACGVKEVHNYIYVLPVGWASVGLDFEYDLCRSCTQAARNVITDWIKESK